MAKQGFHFNQDDCIGCKTCQTACKDKNDLPIGKVFRNLLDFETGTYPDASVYHYAKTCNHCEEPACVAGCPTGAMFIDEADGTTQHDDSMCIGCQACVNNCPYEVPVYFEEDNISRKCDACIALREIGEDPACVAGCQTRALTFGPIDDLATEFADAVTDLPILPDSSVTSPCTLITPKACALEEDFTIVRL